MLSTEAREAHAVPVRMEQMLEVPPFSVTEMVHVPPYENLPSPPHLLVSAWLA